MRCSVDVVVVGAGPAGYLASKVLRERGLRVLVVEAGPLLSSKKNPPEVDPKVWAYRAEGGTFDWVRVRAVRGRTLFWGGWSYRFPDRVLRRAGFPDGRAVLDPIYADIERRLGVIEGVVDTRYKRAARALDLHILPKRAPVTRGGEIWTPFAGQSARSVRTSLAALSLEHTRGRAVALACIDLSTRKTERIAAGAFVLAASPIETARIVLQSDLPRSRVGRGLVDHLVASYLLIEPRPAPGNHRRGAFPGCALVESFVNLDRRTKRAYPGGFSTELTGPVPLDALDVQHLVPRSEVHHHSVTQIIALGESFPHDKRFVSLDPKRRDSVGRPVPIIHVVSSRQDAQLATDMKKACVAFADAIAIAGSRLVFVEPVQQAAGHEAGTCAMGDGNAPCDRTGRLRALENVWIADASALPTAGDRHPTLTLLAHAQRAAHALAESFSGACRNRRR